MSWSDFYLLCFAIGTLWSVVALVLGGLHMGHGHAHIGHSHGPHVHLQNEALGWLGSMANPGCTAIFLAWFGGVGYLLTRHSGLVFWLNLVVAMAVGLT